MNDTHRVWYLNDKEGHTDCVLYDPEFFVEHMARGNTPVITMELDVLETKDNDRVEEWIEISRKVIMVTDSYNRGEDTYSADDVRQLTQDIELYASEGKGEE